MKSVFLFACLLISGGLFAQKSTSWSLYKDMEKIKIETKTAQCTFKGTPNETHEYIYVRLTNKTSETVTVNFRIDSYYDGVCRSCENEEYNMSFTIPAGKSVEPVCGNPDFHKLTVFVKNLTRQNFNTFDKFEITEVLVK